uniref:UBC core domain-containing protein n=1 Tax=Panagrellus redivivus TaxID=6233 RepID=A0A7E4VH33_PANRE
MSHIPHRQELALLRIDSFIFSPKIVCYYVFIKLGATVEVICFHFNEKFARSGLSPRIDHRNDYRSNCWTHPATTIKIHFFRRCFPHRRGDAASASTASIDHYVDPTTSKAAAAATAAEAVAAASAAGVNTGIGLSQFESSRLRILALVTGSKQVVISTGRAITRVVMGNTISTANSPEQHEDVESICERLNHLIEIKPWRMSDMMKIIGILGEATPEMKIQFYNAGVIDRLCKTLRSANNVEGIRANTAIGKRKRNSPSAGDAAMIPPARRGVGYGRGSTKSQWDIERTVEERIAQEEHLMWLLCALNTFLWGDTLRLAGVNAESLSNIGLVNHPHIIDGIEQMIIDTGVFQLLEYNLNNDSIFDVSQHLDFYQSLIELTAGLSLLPKLLPHLVVPKDGDSRSIAKELVPKFRDGLNAYINNTRLPVSPDFTLVDFVNRINDLSDLVLFCARKYESELPPERRIKTAHPRSREASATASTSSASSGPQTVEMIYQNGLRALQLRQWRLVDEHGLPIYSNNFKKDIKAINPASNSNRDRSRRVAKELASMSSALPLTLSSSIFVAMDESRVDVLKVLITGPDDTPYQNGCFEFDVFFPSAYPNCPVKCQFLTTGRGTVRFNPNLYADGKVCLSILGTWEGRPEEKWNPLCTCLQVLISIQALILVKHPYFNEPGFERQQDSAKGDELSRKYNINIEHATLVHAMYEQLMNPPVYFEDIIRRHFWVKREEIIKQAEKWIADATRNVPAAELNEYEGHIPAISTGPDSAVRKLIHELRNMQNPFPAERPPTAAAPVVPTSPSATPSAPIASTSTGKA